LDSYLDSDLPFNYNLKMIETVDKIQFKSERDIECGLDFFAILLQKLPNSYELEIIGNLPELLNFNTIYKHNPTLKKITLYIRNMIEINEPVDDNIFYEVDEIGEIHGLYDDLSDLNSKSTSKYNNEYNNKYELFKSDCEINQIECVIKYD
jgi:hypothetical protein